MKGFSLIEVLLALAIFSIGLLAIAKLHIMILKDERYALQQSLAVVEKDNSLERYYINPHGAKT